MSIKIFGHSNAIWKLL